MIQRDRLKEVKDSDRRRGSGAKRQRWQKLKRKSVGDCRGVAGLENKREIFKEHLCVAWLLGNNTVAKERRNEKREE